MRLTTKSYSSHCCTSLQLCCWSSLWDKYNVAWTLPLMATLTWPHTLLYCFICLIQLWENSSWRYQEADESCVPLRKLLNCWSDVLSNANERKPRILQNEQEKTGLTSYFYPQTDRAGTWMTHIAPMVAVIEGELKGSQRGALGHEL